ncbi:hypothetical protein J2S74_005554 [Evansella vedderi]|uniref:Uncharacterized protein n=1 Tax=Evansella vedderi TaxID=38282 RepID=A0ABU0A3L8_9BACI|nr:hypothetical protein [Evansella vedderi]MDQ0258090.1 hypothetical protein [Evansella vedderi]
MTITEQKFFFRILGICCYVTTILYLVEHFIISDIIRYTYSFLGFTLLVCSILFIPNVNRIVIIALLISGSIFFYIERISFGEILLSFGENINLLSLFLLIPLIGTFMSTAGYLSALKEKVQKWEKKGGKHPYFISFSLTATIGVLLNFGSMAIVKRIADESFSSYRDQKLTIIIMRGFGFCMLWSPYFVNVGLVLVLFELSWFDIGGYGLALSLIYLFMCVIMFKGTVFPDDPIVEHNHDHDLNSNTGQSLIPFITFCIVLIFLSLLLDYMLEVNMLTVVSLLAVIFPLIWALFTKLFFFYAHDVFEQVQASFSRIKNELAVFISAGFFGVAISNTELGTHISTLLFQISFGSVYLLTVFIVLLATLLAQVGIHPVIIIIGIGSALTPDKFGVSGEYLALVLLIAWTVAAQLSPFSGQVLMASRLMGKTPIVLVKHNFRFVFFLGILLTAALYGFYIIGLL